VIVLKLTSTKIPKPIKLGHFEKKMGVTLKT